MASILFVVIILLQLHQSVIAVSERDLVTSLMTGYQKDARPTRNPSGAVQVSLDVTLAQIIDVNVKEQALTTNLWIRQHWRDDFLTWNTSAYGNIKSVNIKSDTIWRPDTILYNRIHDEGWSETPDTQANVYNTGDVKWGYPVTIRSSCVMDVSRFPFDVQTCHFKFGSWTYNGLQLNLVNHSNTGDTSEFIRNGEWSLISFEFVRNEIVYSCCPGVFYPDITYWLVIRRRTLYYTYYVVFPTLLLALLAMLGFFLPPDSGEKLSLSITLLLALMVFMQLVTDKLPPLSTSIPVIGIFFGAMILLVTTSSALTIFVLTLHFQGPDIRPVPDWLRTVFFLGPSKARKTLVIKNKHAQEMERGVKEPSSQSRGINGPLTVLGRIEKAVNHFMEDHSTKSHLRALEMEWKILAVRMDRCFFVIFLLALIIATAAILGSA